MEHYRLPAYNKARELATQLSQSTKKVPKDVRYTWVREMELATMNIMKDLSFANYDLDKRSIFLNQAIDTLKELKIKVRILFDLKHIPLKSFDIIIKKEEELSRQLNGWLASEEKKSNKPSQ